MPANRRHAYFVHKRIQLALAARMLLQLVLFACIIAVLSAIAQLLFDPLQERHVRYQHLQMILASIITAAFCLMPVFVWEAIKFSHRFVGPIIRLHSVLKSAQNGKLERIRLRKNDFWQDLAADFNRFADRIEAQVDTPPMPGMRAIDLSPESGNCPDPTSTAR